MFIDTQYPWTGAVRHLRAPLPTMALIPALDGCRTDAVGARDLALSDAAIMRFEHLEPKRFRRSEARPNALEPVAEIAPALWAVVLGRLQVQGHHLVTLTRVLEGSLTGRLDPHPLVLAMNARGASGRPGIDLDALVPINLLDLKVRYA